MATVFSKFQARSFPARPRPSTPSPVFLVGKPLVLDMAQAAGMPPKSWSPICFWTVKASPSPGLGSGSLLVRLPGPSVLREFFLELLRSVPIIRRRILFRTSWETLLGLLASLVAWRPPESALVKTPFSGSNTGAAFFAYPWWLCMMNMALPFGLVTPICLQTFKAITCTSPCLVSRNMVRESQAASTLIAFQTTAVHLA